MNGDAAPRSRRRRSGHRGWLLVDALECRFGMPAGGQVVGQRRQVRQGYRPARTRQSARPARLRLPRCPRPTRTCPRTFVRGRTHAQRSCSNTSRNRAASTGTGLLASVGSGCPPPGAPASRRPRCRRAGRMRAPPGLSAQRYARRTQPHPQSPRPAPAQPMQPSASCVPRSATRK